MAVAVSKNANGNTSGNATSLTWSHVSDGNPLYVLVAFNSTARFATGVTFNGVALTLKARYDTAGVGLELWTLDAPASTTANVVVSASATGLILGGSFSVSGGMVPSVLTADNFVGANGSSTAPTATISSRTGDLVLGLCNNATTSQTFTSGGSQSRIFTNTAANTNEHGAADTKAGAASVTMSWTLGTTGVWGVALISIPVSSAASTVRVSQEAAELFGSGAKEARVSQEAIELFGSGSKAVRTSQVAIEVFTPNSVSPQRVSQFALEVYGAGAKQVLVSQLAIEIFRQNVTASTSTFPALLLAG
jgi:hypothetical protein